MLEQTAYTYIKLLICHVVRHRVNFMGFVPIFICQLRFCSYRAFFLMVYLGVACFFFSSSLLSTFSSLNFSLSSHWLASTLLRTVAAPFGEAHRALALTRSEMTWYYKRTRVLLKVLSILAFLWLFCGIEHLYAFRSRLFFATISF